MSISLGFSGRWKHLRRRPNPYNNPTVVILMFRRFSGALCGGLASYVRPTTYLVSIISIISVSPVKVRSLSLRLVNISFISPMLERREDVRVPIAGRLCLIK